MHASKTLSPDDKRTFNKVQLPCKLHSLHEPLPGDRGVGLDETVCRGYMDLCQPIDSLGVSEKTW